MTARRLVEIGLAAIAAGYATLVLFEESGRGFPDGHLTELERALRAPRYAVVLVAIGLAGAFARGGWSARGRLGLGLAFGALVLAERIGFPMLGAALGLAGGGGG